MPDATPRPAERRRSSDWYVTVTLASITVLFFCFALALDIWMLVAGDEVVREPPAGALLPLLGVAAMVAGVSVFSFWIRMLNDYFHNRPEKSPVAWGWALFLLNIWGALAYFWFVWRPRNNPT